jgi:hypothetical protein
MRQRRVDTEAARAVSVVQHLASLPVWERKARRVAVDPRGRHGSYIASGRIAGLIPWRATFDYELTDVGFHSWMPGPKMGVQVAGGFHVISHGTGACTIVHYEQYRFPVRSRLLTTAWRLYVAPTMDAELERVALLARPALAAAGPINAASIKRDKTLPRGEPGTAVDGSPGVPPGLAAAEFRPAISTPYSPGAGGNRHDPN